MRKVYSTFTITVGVIKSWSWDKNVHSSVFGRFSVFYELTKKRTIHLCLHYHTHGGKKQCCYCVIGRHKSWGCELANPATHHNGCYVWQRNSQKRALCYTWDLWQRGDYSSIWVTNWSFSRDTYIFISYLNVVELFEGILTEQIQRQSKYKELPDLFLILWGLLTFS